MLKFVNIFLEITTEINGKPDGSDRDLATSGFIFARNPKLLVDSASFLLGGVAKITSRSAGSVKQLLPVSSNFRHLARVLHIKATCFGIFVPLFEPLLPRFACHFYSKRHLTFHTLTNNGE